MNIIYLPVTNRAVTNFLKGLCLREFSDDQEENFQIIKSRLNDYGAKYVKSKLKEYGAKYVKRPYNFEFDFVSQVVVFETEEQKLLFVLKFS